MNILVHSKGIDLLPEEKDYCRSKASLLLDRASVFKENEALKIQIEMDKENVKISSEQFFCAITIYIPSKTLRVETHCGGVYSAMDKAYEMMDKRLHEEKEKKRGNAL